MIEKNLGQRFLIIGGVILFAILMYSSYGLRPGNDIAGGVSMVFEIDTAGAQPDQNLAEDMKQLLQRRVDPKGVYGLEWRVMGNNRLEVQMPLPPREVADLRKAYDDSIRALSETHITRGELQRVLSMQADERESEIDRLSAFDASGERKALLPKAAEAAEAWGVAQARITELRAAEVTEPTMLREAQIALRDAEENRDDRFAAVMATNFPVNQFRDVLDLPEGAEDRIRVLSEWEVEFSALKDKIDTAVAAHKVWRENATFLDGPEDLRRLLRGAGVLSFRILVEPNPDNLSKYDRLREMLADRGPRAASTAEEGWFKIDDPVNFFNLESAADVQTLDPRNMTSSVAGKYAGDWYVLAHTDASRQLLGSTKRDWQLTTAFRSVDQMGRPNVMFEFDPRGGALFGDLTGKNVNKQLSVFVDDVAYSAANINERISGSGTISGQFTESKVRYLIRSMNAGALPARLKDTPISERTLGSSLGEANRDRALTAGIIGLAVVCAVMFIYYSWSAGGVAILALVLNVFLVLAVMSMLSARISLAGIAGIILTIGMTVDANVLIFERIREEKLRGASLRMMIKNGYDKALSTIVDANITTLLTSIIIAYVGSEEIKGFGVTLGWGIVTSLFTSLFVTRTIFAMMIKFQIIKDIKMMNLIGVPKIDWYAKRRMFLPISATVIVVGLGLLFSRGAEALDVEFRGGVNAEFELRSKTLSDGQSVNDIVIQNLIEEEARSLSEDASSLASVTVETVAGDPALFRVRAGSVTPERLAALLTEPLEDREILSRAGIDTDALPDGVTIRIGSGHTQEDLIEAIAEYAADAPQEIATLSRAKINRVIDTESPELDGLTWSVTTTVTNKRLVEYALEEAMGTNLRRQAAIDFTFQGDGSLPYAITAGTLREVIPNLPSEDPIDVTRYLDGAAMYFTDLDPPVAVEALSTRLRNMRLQPDYAELPWRQFEVLGVNATTGADDEGRTLYDSIAIVVLDNETAYSESRENWAMVLAEPELGLAKAALGTEQSLRKVSTFKPQIASQSQQKAIIALLLSWIMIVVYLWVRFGKPTYGVAGVAALIHDVLIALAAVGISGFLGSSGMFGFLLIHDFPINMTIVAAFLTIIGYSINDTIVVFDRIRETRGRLGQVTPDVINTSINQCLARTIMTSATTMLVLLTMYIFGGDSIRGFNYCMIVGIITGTYSSIAVAAPILMMRLQKADMKARQAATA